MHSSVKRVCSIAAMLVLGVVFAGKASATTSTFAGGRSWQIGDIVVCFGSTGNVGGTCNVLRNTSAGLVLLDQISDGLLGATSGVAINNTLHLLVTDNGASQSGHTSNVVMYSIASVDPIHGGTIPHAVLQTFDASNGGASSNAEAVAIDSAGDMFVANAGGGTTAPTIVELDAHGNFVGSHPVPSSCIDTQLARMDLRAIGSSIYLTSQGGTIQEFSLSGNTCTAFAKLGSVVRFDGIRDIPPGALTSVAVSCNGTTPCPPTGETVLVVARGFFDSNGDGTADQTHDHNVCTNLVNSPLVSCALLLKTDGPGLTFPAWIANHSYSVGTKILDANLHVQNVTAISGSGKSGTTTPAWKTDGTTTTDNKVTWTDLGTSVVARYQVTGTSTLQALTLDPFVTNCTSNSCANNYTPARKINNFSVGDSQFPNFYSVNFGTGNVNGPLNANADCSSDQGCVTQAGIQGIGIYGGEGAVQPGLAQLLTPAPLVPDNSTPTKASAQTVTFLQNSATVTLYGLTGPVNLALYASLVDPNSCFNDQQPFLPCRVTTSVADGAKPIVWKIDVPQGTASLSNFLTTSIAAKYQTAQLYTPVEAIDNGTDVFTDMLYDTTVLVGNGDPTQFTKPSVQSLHEVNVTVGGASCTFLSPSANTCYKTNRGTLPFAVPQCSGLTVSQFQSLGLQAPSGGLSLVQTFGPSQAPLPVDLSGTNGGATNGKASFRYDASSNQWVYQFSMSSLNGRTGTFTGCAFDSSGTVQTFCVRNVQFQTTCP
jgi:hypothetical protein